MGRAEAQIHLLCGMKIKTSPPKSISAILNEGQGLPCLVYANDRSCDSFHGKKEIQMKLV